MYYCTIAIEALYIQRDDVVQVNCRRVNLTITRTRFRSTSLQVDATLQASILITDSQFRDITTDAAEEPRKDPSEYEVTGEGAAKEFEMDGERERRGGQYMGGVRLTVTKGSAEIVIRNSFFSRQVGMGSKT